MSQLTYTLIAFTLAYFLAHMFMFVFVHEPRRQHIEQQFREHCNQHYTECQRKISR